MFTFNNENKKNSVKLKKSRRTKSTFPCYSLSGKGVCFIGEKSPQHFPPVPKSCTVTANKYSKLFAYSSQRRLSIACANDLNHFSVVICMGLTRVHSLQLFIFTAAGSFLRRTCALIARKFCMNNDDRYIYGCERRWLMIKRHSEKLWKR